MSIQLIQHYYAKVDRIIEFGGKANPAYRAKYELNLKRDFPRIPIYENFGQWRDWGKRLMALHLDYETAEPYPLERI